MTVRNLLDIYGELHTLLKEKREILATRKIDELSGLDEKIVSVYTEIEKMAKTQDITPTEEEKEEIRLLAQKIQKIEYSNQEAIKYSLGVIGKIFDGIMNMARKTSSSYDNSGKLSKNQDLNLSSIIEEA